MNAHFIYLSNFRFYSMYQYVYFSKVLAILASLDGRSDLILS